MSSVASFQNPGLIDPRCITTIGVSVKESENPIGFFGTGLKYAIAIILRHGGRITIWRGLEALRFDTHEVVIREKPVKVVCMNGVELGFTIELGKHWELWQAFREIYCNTLDERGDASLSAHAPAADRTTIHVELEPFADCLRALGRYVLQSRPLHGGAEAQFHPPMSSDAIFYRGILVHHTGKPFAFTPNVMAKMTLTEDRTLALPYEAIVAIAKTVVSSQDEDFLERWLTSPSGSAEHELDLDWTSAQPSPQFFKVVGRLARDTSRPLNLTALRIYTRSAPEPDVDRAEMLDSERAQLEKAIAFCRALTYPVDEFEICIVESLGEGILGRASRESRRIFIAKRAMQMGDLNLASTLIEEWCHIKHGHKDMSREMQNWLFDQVARLGQAFLFERDRHGMREAA